MGVITFNGVTSTSLGIVVEHPPNYEIPEKIYNITQVPGRNDAIVVDTGAYSNVDRSYDIAVGAEGANFASLASAMVNWLQSGSGYVRFEDSYLPDVYMLGVYKDSLDVINILQQAGRATIKINRQPQRFLKSGDSVLTYTAAGVAKNPTQYKSLPIIKVYGKGTGEVKIGTHTIKMDNLVDYFIINSEIGDVYKNGSNLNLLVELVDGFPKLISGNNNISFSGGVTKVEITPKWWRL